MPSFIFEILTSEVNDTIDFPVINTNYSFIGVTTSATNNNGITTVIYNWINYVNNSPDDGLCFNTNVSYYNSPSINIKQFGGLALPNMTSFSNASFFRLYVFFSSYLLLVFVYT